MHRSSSKKLISKLRLGGRSAKTKLGLSAKRPRIARLETSKSSLAEPERRLRTPPANGANGQAKPMPRFLSDAALVSAEQLLGSIKSQSGADLSEKIGRASCRERGERRGGRE